MTRRRRELSTDPLRVMMVCTGNICRSPMAEAILRASVLDSELADRVVVDSAGTHGYHLGEEADRRARAALSEAGYPLAHRARRFRSEWFTERDLILTMDSGHYDDLLRMARKAHVSAERVRAFRDFDPLGPGDVPDPYYDTMTEFREVRAILERCMPALLDHLRTLT